jgi:hypothetical protein
MTSRWLLLVFWAISPIAWSAPDATSSDTPKEATTQALIDEGWRRIDVDDFEGAHLMAREVRLREQAEFLEEAGYLSGVSLHRSGRLSEATAELEDVRMRWPDGGRYHDATFRIAMLHAEGGAPQLAITTLRDLGPAKKLPREGQRKVALCSAWWTLQSGKTRKGLKLITRELERTEPHEATWFQASVRTAMVDVLIANANAHDYAVSETKLERVMSDRAALLIAAESQLEATIPLDEPLPILRQILAIGHGYADSGQDFLDAPMPSLPLEQQARYHAQVQELANISWIKAIRFYELGLNLGLRVAWEAPIIAELHEALDTAESKVALPLSGHLTAP